MEIWILTLAAIDFWAAPDYVSLTKRGGLGSTVRRQDHAHIGALGDMNCAWFLSVIGLSLLIWGLVLLLLLVFI